LNPKLIIHVGSPRAGTLEQRPNGYRFAYEPDYKGPPVFLGIPVAQGSREWDAFPPPFDGLLPEGQLLEQLLVTRKLDRSDKWGQLAAVGGDLTGFLSALPEDSSSPPHVSAPPEGPIGRRAPIQPGKESLPYAVRDLVTYHSQRPLRMSISGIQPKVAAIFRRKDRRFEIVPARGAYLLKPSPPAFPGTAENEALTMHLARLARIEVPPCGLVWSRDGQPVFWIERFDRRGQANRVRIRCEDACQLLGVPSSWKYLGNIESLIRVVRECCGNPALQLAQLYRRILFCWISGNGDMHLKNWSLIETGGMVKLSPAYDLLNTHLLLPDEEESALSLCDRKTNWDRSLLVKTLAAGLCGLKPRMTQRILDELAAVPWQERIQSSELSENHKAVYGQLVDDRLRRLGLRV
jgi:serine/threonine-protein kinase HipA